MVEQPGQVVEPVQVAQVLRDVGQHDQVEAAPRVKGGRLGGQACTYREASGAGCGDRGRIRVQPFGPGVAAGVERLEQSASPAADVQDGCILARQQIFEAVGKLLEALLVCRVLARAGAGGAAILGKLLIVVIVVGLGGRGVGVGEVTGSAGHQSVARREGRVTGLGEGQLRQHLRLGVAAQGAGAMEVREHDGGWV